jgi:hypothetical protein
MYGGSGKVLKTYTQKEVEKAFDKLNVYSRFDYVLSENWLENPLIGAVEAQLEKVKSGPEFIKEFKKIKLGGEDRPFVTEHTIPTILSFLYRNEQYLNDLMGIAQTFGDIARVKDYLPRLKARTKDVEAVRKKIISMREEIESFLVE